MKTSFGASILCGAIISLALAASAQSNLVLQIQKNGANIPAILSWDSKTNEIYSVLYSTNLANGWQTAVTNFSNQGTNTIWSDTGLESGFGIRPSSADYDAPIRFYRLGIQGYTSNSFPAMIIFSNVADGAVFSELTNVFASATSPSNLISGKLSVDGNDVAFDSGGSYDFPLETRFFPNGTHRLSITVEDNGDSGTTGGDDPDGPVEGSDPRASYAAQNISVVFSNFLSDVRLKYQGYRPELGQTQIIYATWASPRDWEVDITPADDTSTVYRSFGGSGISVVVPWDGLDSNGNPLDPKRLAYVIYDLGASSQSASSSLSTSQSASTQNLTPPPSPPLPNDTNYWSRGNETTQEESLPTIPSTVTWDSATGTQRTITASSTSFSPNVDNNSPFIIYGPYKTLGSFGMLYQGDHPWFSPSNRPQRGAPFGQATLSSSHNPPWGGLRGAYRIADSLVARFWISGYQTTFVNGDDDFTASMLQKSSLGGQNIFNSVNIGLYVGHSAACKENIVALGHPQSYIAVYNRHAGTMTWVGMADMDLGSSNLKWVAFYSCNMFRDDAYRSDGVYTLMKDNEHLAMNANLHIMQGYATEMTIRHDMAEFWVPALTGLTADSNNSTVLGAWRYVCLKTQPVESSANANVSRSAYWEECAGDHIYGYGSQTDPDPDHIQEELLEDDQMANTTP